VTSKEGNRTASRKKSKKAVPRQYLEKDTNDNLSLQQDSTENVESLLGAETLIKWTDGWDNGQKEKIRKIEELGSPHNRLRNNLGSRVPWAKI